MKTYKVLNFFSLIIFIGFFNVSYEVDEESEVSVSLVSINSSYDNFISLSSESRPPGEYTDGFDLGQVAAGVYLLIVDINGLQIKKKRIIN